jgi:lipopolysaccharide transport system permease protein
MTARSTAVRPGPLGLIREAIGEVWSRRMLIRYLVQADIRKKGADTLLGNLWWLLDPLLQLLVYVVLVQVIFQVRVPDYALFVFSAILPWKWFSSSVNDAILSVTSQDRLIKQVKFPKIVLPLAAVMAGIANFAFGLVPLLGLMIVFYADRLSPLLLLIPIVAVVQLAFTTAVALVVGSVNVFFRDIGNLARHGLRIWFYLSPGLYSLDRVAEVSPGLAALLRLNPFTVLFEAYRAVIYGTPDGGPTLPDWGALAALLVVSLVLVSLATVFFKRLEPFFAKVL